MVIKKDYTFTYKDVTDRKRKNLAILDSIRRKGEISRTDISKETGINIVSVSNYIMNYIRKGLVLECGRDISTGGRRPELVRLNLESAYVAGLDIGPEKMVAIITDLGLKIKTKVVVSRPTGSMEMVMNSAADVVDKLFKEFKSPLQDIKLIGIGASGVVDIVSGTIHDTDPARGRTRSSLFLLIRMLEDKFHISSLVGNDATCAAFGELTISPDTELSEMLYVYGDVGCGIIINRDIYCGASGSAGEIQLIINPEFAKKLDTIKIASYGVKGADLGIVNSARKNIEKVETSKILELADGKKEKITKEIIFKAAQNNDRLAREILIDAAYWLGIKIAYLINVFNPQLVVIGGGIERAGDVFDEALISCVKMYAFEESFNATNIVPSFLGEDAIAVGACSLSIRELFINA